MTGRRILFVGGGTAALSKLKSLDPYRPILRLVAVEILPEVELLLASWPEVVVNKRGFIPQDLDDVMLAYVFTNSPQTNVQIAQMCRDKNILVNAAGLADRDFTSPASVPLGDLTLSVSSGGKNIGLAVKWRDKFKSFWENSPDTKEL